MKKALILIAAMTIVSLGSCNSRDVKVDTAGAVRAKVINTVEETTEITVSVDTTDSQDNPPANIEEVVPPETAEALNKELEKEDKQKQTDNTSEE